MVILPAYKREIANYKTERIPAKAAADKTEQKPGLLCWGDTGTIPKPVPVSTSFNVEADEEHTELSRQTEPVVIESDDGSVTLTAARTKQLLFEKKDSGKTGQDSGNNNTDTGGEDFGDFSPSSFELSHFAPLGSAAAKKKLLVKFSHNDGTI